MRLIINFVLFGFVGIVVTLAGVAQFGATATETVRRGNIELVHTLDTPTEQAGRVAEIMSLRSMLGVRNDTLSLRLETENGRRKLWLAYDFQADNAEVSVEVGEVMISGVAAAIEIDAPAEVSL